MIENESNVKQYSLRLRAGGLTMGKRIVGTGRAPKPRYQSIFLCKNRGVTKELCMLREIRCMDIGYFILQLGRRHTYLHVIWENERVSKLSKAA